jgi:uncharacterized protein YdeI (YjbR/CyaY-like superfamily)
MKATTVDQYLAAGCGRCKKGGTPDCVVHRWDSILVEMRALALECNLFEEVKWSVPCYTLYGKNIVMIGAFKDHCSFMFMKGSLLQDNENHLYRQTENVTSGRQMRFTSLKEFHDKRAITKHFILEAMRLEREGVKVPKKTEQEPIPMELQVFFDHDEAFNRAFFALTPGRQRAYLIHFNQPKQAETRTARIEKCKAMILRGEGLHDAYRKGM